MSVRGILSVFFKLVSSFKSTLNTSSSYCKSREKFHSAEVYALTGGIFLSKIKRNDLIN